MVAQTVTVNSLPAVYTVTGGGHYCTGDTGTHVTLSGSALGINYRLYNGGTPVGTVVAGTGTGIDFGLMTAAGTYTAVAADATTGCTSNMAAAVAITIDPLPTVYPMAGGGAYCAGGPGVHVRISNTDAGVSYQLMIGTIAMGTPGAGTGSPYDFGLETVPGIYKVIATNGTSHCSASSSDSVTVTINPLPVAGTITGPTHVCAGANITLTDISTGGVWNSSHASATISTGGVVTGVFIGTTTISYTVTNGCGTATAVTTVTVDSLANAGMITGRDSVCPGDTIVLHNTVTIGAWTSNDTTIAKVGLLNGIVKGIAHGTDTIIYNVVNTCGLSQVMHEVYVRSSSECVTGTALVNPGIEQLTVSPNPGNGLFVVNVSSDANEAVTLVLTNMTGQKIKEYTTMTNRPFSMRTDVAAGMYFLTAATEHRKYVTKIIVQ
jgi:hypothetical protein